MVRLVSVRGRRGRVVGWYSVLLRDAGVAVRCSRWAVAGSGGSRSRGRLDAEALAVALGVGADDETSVGGQSARQGQRLDLLAQFILLAELALRSRYNNSEPDANRLV